MLHRERDFADWTRPPRVVGVGARAGEERQDGVLFSLRHSFLRGGLHDGLVPEQPAPHKALASREQRRPPPPPSPPPSPPPQTSPPAQNILQRRRVHSLWLYVSLSLVRSLVPRLALVIVGLVRQRCLQYFFRSYFRSFFRSFFRYFFRSFIRSFFFAFKKTFHLTRPFRIHPHDLSVVHRRHQRVQMAPARIL